ncbi:MAG: metal ABC transporter permease [Crocinitomicaceae bacterium]|nr:metal ABC transporter permease [Crocinitomicaceae bacterium]
MDTFLDFISFKDPNVIYVVLGVVFINAASALIGTFALLRKRALIGDAIAHSLLPGVCLGFLAAGEKNLIFLMFGAVITGWLSTFAVDIIVNRSKVKQDAAIGIVLSTFFAIGIVLLTYIQNHASGQQAGLETFLFGQAAAISRQDVIIFLVVLLVVLVAIIAFYRTFVLVTFNREYAITLGVKVKAYEFLITTLTVLSIAAGIQALGVILMSALVITPAAVGRLWSDQLPKIILLAVVFSIISGIGGAFVSYSSAQMPTGPWVVLLLSAIVGFSILFSPKKGIIARYKKSRENRLKILRENILKSIYVYHEKMMDKSLSLQMTVTDIMETRRFDTDDLTSGLRYLTHKGYLAKQGKSISLTDSGKKESKRIVRLHRLWEQYLLKKTTIDSDHVHSGAEAIEHIITPELEKELVKELGITGIPEEDY